MPARRVSETLVVSDQYIAERVGRWGVRQWKIWRLKDVLMRPPPPIPVFFYAQTGHDAIQMIEHFEANGNEPSEGAVTCKV
jgi:hypothetical protein